MYSFPRILILTAWRASGRYAGAEAMRRVLGSLPSSQIRWASLDEEPEAEVAGIQTRGFPPRRAHWRLHEGVVDFISRDHFDSRRLTGKIADWVIEFEPEVLWVLPELQAVPVALLLQKALNIPIHATAYDAPENALFVCVPKLYAAAHMRLVKRFYGKVSSVDAISQELADYLREAFLPPAAGVSVLPASVEGGWITQEREDPDFRSKLRRIAFCGAMRTPPDQWASFLGQLASQPYQFEIVAYAADNGFSEYTLPPNVTIRQMSYLESEEELIAGLAASGACCGYVGLPREGLGEHFARTSLSSKLTAYAAAGLPILVDGSEESAAWHLVSKHNAGVRVTGVVGDLEALCSDELKWETLAAASRQMAREEFSLERNIPALIEQLRATAESDHRH